MEHVPLALRLVLSAMAVVSIVVPWLADWNESHVFNPHWRPHAKYHNAQTLFLGVAAGGASLALLWLPLSPPGNAADLVRWDLAALFAGLYQLVMAPGILVPGTAHEDPEYPGRLPQVGGVVLNQTILASAWVVAVAAVWWFGRAPLAAAVVGGG